MLQIPVTKFKLIVFFKFVTKCLNIYVTNVTTV